MTRRATLLGDGSTTVELDQDRVRADRRRLVRAARKAADTRRISSRGRWREDWPDTDDLMAEQVEEPQLAAASTDLTGAGRGAAVQEGGEVADVEVVPPAPLFAAVPMTGMLDAAPYADTAAQGEAPEIQPAIATASTYANLYSSYIAQAAEAARYSAEYANRADAEDAADEAAEMAYGLGRVYAEADPPLALHRHHVALGPAAGLPNQTAYYLGGMEWTADFARYIGGAVPKAVAAERRRRECWWLDPTICARVESVLGAFALAALLAWLRDDVPYHTVIRKARKGERWLARQQSKAEHALRDWGVGRLPAPTWLRPAIEMAELYVA